MTIYLDNNATTALDTRVLEAMHKDVGPLNPSSIHSYGQRAKKLLAKSRAQISDYFRVKPHEIIFTSCGTEALNMLIMGLIGPNDHIISTDIEHAAIFNTLQSIENEVTYLKCGDRGHPTPQAILDSLTEKTKLLVFSAVNGETGVMLDIEEIAKIATEHNLLLVIDGVALLGKSEVSIPNGISAMAFSAHKCQGPKGIGLAYLNSKVKFKPSLFGGPQEQNRRAGTENLSGVLGFSKAIELIDPQYFLHMREKRDFLEEYLQDQLPQIEINGTGKRICNTSNVFIDGVDGETLLINLDQRGVCISLGSACGSGALEPSRVLLNMGYTRKRANQSIRISISRDTSFKEIKKAAEIIVNTIRLLRGD